MRFDFFHAACDALPLDVDSSLPLRRVTNEPYAALLFSLYAAAATMMFDDVMLPAHAYCRRCRYAICRCLYAYDTPLPRHYAA